LRVTPTALEDVFLGLMQSAGSPKKAAA